MGTHARDDAPERRGRLRRSLRWVLPVVVLALVAGGLVAWRTGWAEEQLRALRGDGEAPADPAAVAAPPEVDTRPVTRPGPVAAAAPTAVPAAGLDAAAVRRALAPLNARPLGPHVLAAVGPLEGTGLTVTRGTDAAVPASTTKIVTSAAALFLLGPDHTFATRTVLQPSSGAGAVPRLVLVGGGDPYLTRAPLPAADAAAAAGTATFNPLRADLRTLARRTAAELKAAGTTSVALGYDATVFSGPAVNPTWEPDYVPDVVTPVSGLWIDEGRRPGLPRSLDPARDAAAAFRAELVAAGVAVVNTPRPLAAAPAATAVASVTSPTLAQIVQRVLEVSDNDGAEVLLRHVGRAEGGAGTSAAGQAGVRRALAANGITMTGSVLHDGSGLSRANRLRPSVLIDVLRLAASKDHPDLRPVLTGLPVAGYTGSLDDRMATALGRGRVRAKTGTLTGVTSLAGIAVDADGTPIVFALMADRVRPDGPFLAQTALDRAAAALGSCRCG